MVNISVPFPKYLREQAEAAARERGLSFDEFVRQCVLNSLDRVRSADPLFADTRVFADDVPADLSANHDRYLYESDT